MQVTPRNLLILFMVVALVALPTVAPVFKSEFLVSTFTRIIIFAIAAVSLDFILGYAGMVSFGHAAFFGLGGYVVAILSYHSFENISLFGLPLSLSGTDSALIAWPIAILITGLVALVIGALSLRSEGVFFIMITLAFSQMIYFTMMSMSQYGGDDGLNISGRNTLPFIDTRDDSVFYYLCLAILVAFVAFCRRLTRSRWGMVLLACRQNEKRARALGIWPFPYKLAAFVLSGAGTGLAGALMANQTIFISSHDLRWQISGDLMVMVILGGIGTLYGPIIGAAIYLLLSEFLGVRELFGSIAYHWQFVFGCLLVLVVIYAPRGVLNWFPETWR